MKIGLIVFLLALISSCEFHNNRVAYIKITSLGFSPATTGTTDGEPIQATGPIPAANLAIQFYYDYERSGDGDAYEDGITNLNPIVKFQIWSPQTFSGRAPNTSLNTLFKNKLYLTPLIEDGELEISTTVISIDQQYPPKIGYLLSTNSSITPGNYDLYFRCEFHDGSVILDSIMNLEIE
jgi:hypothetical protein